jgi:ribosomal protein S18 acetylase RimI-like enzyme
MNSFLEAGLHARLLVPADQGLLWELLYHALYVPAGAPPPPRTILSHPDVARYAEGWGRPGDKGFVAESPAGGVLAGGVWLRLLSSDNRGYGWVDDTIPELSIAVLPAWRGRGLGTRLLAHLLSDLDGPVSLSVSKGNPARRLYERCGFRVEGHHGNAYTMLRAATAV